MKRIYLIDCPGVVPPSPNDGDTDILLRGVVRVENVQNPEQYIPAVLTKCKMHHIERTYDIKEWDGDAATFLEVLARKGGKLLKGGEADWASVAKMVLNDFLRGKIPWFTPPPHVEGGATSADGIEGRAGRLGEMSRKRKREETEMGHEKGSGSIEVVPDEIKDKDSEDEEDLVADAGDDEEDDAGDVEEVDFEGFESEKDVTNGTKVKPRLKRGAVEGVLEGSVDDGEVLSGFS